MSTTVDNKVVHMQFDNQRFESNVNQTRSSLDKLKRSLKFESGVAGFQDIEKSARNIDLSNLSTNVSKIQKGFSALGIVGKTVISNLTNSVVNFGKSFVSSIFRLTASGGISRAMNIEQARFQIEGLGKNWNKLSKDILYGVEDTAYGFDEAAKAAAVMAASGVKAGPQMKGALRGISGLAAMTGSSFTEVSDIVGSIAGQGKLMTEQLRQFEHRGINVAAQLAKSMGKTEAEIRDMTTKGKISFEDFAKVMNDAWGAHAKDASKMFTGAASNIKASLSRIGAAFVEPAIATVETSRKYKNLTDVFRSVIDALKTFERYLAKSEALETYMGLLKKASAIATNFFDAISGDTVERDDDDNIISVIKKQSEKWAELRKSMGLTKTTFKNLGDTFTGIGSAIKIVSRLIKGLADFLGPIFSSIGTVFLSVTGAIGRFVTGLEKTTAKADGVKSFFTGISETISSLIKGFGNVISKILGVNQGVKQVSSSFGKIGKSLGSFSDVITSIFKGISTIIDSVFSGINEVLSGKGVGRLSEILNTVFTGGLLITLSEIQVRLKYFLTPWKGFVKTGQSMVTGIEKMFGSITKTFSVMQTQIKAQAIKQIAIALAIFAGSMFILASINPKRLDSALTGMAGLLMELMGMIFALTKMDFGKVNSMKFAGIAFSMIGIAAAVAILAKSVANLAKLDIGGLAKGLVGVGVLLKYIMVFINSIGKTKVNLKSMVSLIAMSYAIKLLASVAKDLGQLKIESLVKGLVGVGILMKAMSQMMTQMGALKSLKMNNGATIKSMVALIALAGAIKILASVVKDLSKLNIEELAKGLISVGVLMKAVSLFSQSMNQTSVSLKSMVGLVIMAGALKLLASVTTDLAKIRIDKLAVGLMGIAGLLFIISKAMKSLAGLKGAMTGALSIIVVSGAIRILSEALKTVSGISWEGLAKGLIAIAGSLFIMTKAMGAMSSTGLKGAAAMIVMAAALRVLVPVLVTLGKMSATQVATALIALAGAFTVIGIAGYVLGGAILPLIGFAAAIALLGVACFAVGAGLASFAAGLLTIVTNAGKMIEGMPLLLDVFRAWLIGLEKLLPEMGLFAAKVILNFLNGIKKTAPQLIDAAADVIVIFLEGFSKKLPMVVDAAFEFIGELVKAIVAGIDKFAGKIQEGGKAIKAETFKLISDALLELSAAAFIMSKIPITGAVKAVAGLAIFANGLGLLLVELGALSKIPGLKDFINEGGKLLGAIGSGIGQLVGGLIGGIGIGITNAMVNMAQNLSSFMKELKPFLDGARSINPASMIGVKAVADVIMALTAAKLMDSLSKIPTLGGLFGGGTFKTLAKDINEFVPAFDSFAEAGEEISEESIKGIQRVAKGAKAIIGLAKDIPNEGGLAKTIFGDNTLSDFADDLTPFITSFAGLAALSTTIKEDAIKKVRLIAKAATTLINMAKEIPNEGGLVSKFTGDNDLSTFADSLGKFGEKFSDLSSNVSEVTDEQIKKIRSVAKAAKSMADVAANLPVMEAGLFTSKIPVSLSDFAKQLSSFGTEFSTFAEAVADISPKSISKAKSVASAALVMADVAAKMPKEKKGIFSSTKVKSLATFAKEFKTFGEKFSELAGSLKDVTKGNINKVKTISEAVKNLASLGKIKATGISNISKFSADLPEIGVNLASYASQVSGVDAKGAKQVNKFLPNLIKTLKSSGNISGIISGEAVANLGKGIKRFAKYVSGIDAKELSSISKSVRSSLKAVSNAVRHSNLPKSFQGEGKEAGNAFAKGISNAKSKCTNAAKAVAKAAKDAAKGVSFVSAGESASEGYATGVKNKAGLIYTAVEDVVKAAYNKGKRAQKTNSPSKIYMVLGESVDEGYAKGIYSGVGMVKRAITSVVGDGSKTAKRLTAGLNSILDSADLSQPVIRPVMDLSNFKMGVQSMDSMLGSSYAIGLAGSIPDNANGSMQSIRNSNIVNNYNNEFTVNGIEDSRQFVQEFSEELGIQARRK